VKDRETIRGVMIAKCGCAKLDLIDQLLRATDAEVAKALSISNVAKIARLEIRARRLLADKWKVRSKAAADTAAKIIANGKSVADASSGVDTIMKRWAGDVKPGYSALVASAYKLARRAGHDKGTGKTTASLQYVMPAEPKVKKASPSPKASIAFKFGLADEKAIEQLSKQEMMWIGEVYENVAPTVNAALKDAVALGLSASDVAQAVADAVSEALGNIAIPSGYNGTATRYFEGLAANAITNVRVQGQIQSFANLGIESYELVNPDDERTTELCHELNGTVFTTEQGIANMQELAKATTPDEYRAAKPFLPPKEVLEMLAKGADVLAAAGQAFPPFHQECRTTVDISEESMDFDALGSGD
jgi:hypothetical protein